jgi:hypothetical protein
LVDESGQLTTPPATLRGAVTLAEKSFLAMHTAASLQNIVSTILGTMHLALTPQSLPLPHIHRWRSWLRTEKINIVSSPYLNQTRGQAHDSEGKIDYMLRIPINLVELVREVCNLPMFSFLRELIVCQTPENYPLSPIHFRFCYVVTVLHELTHLLTKYAFPHELTPKVPESILQFGEAGEGFVHRILGGKLVCEWDLGHIAEFEHLQNLYIRTLDTGIDYPLGECTMAFLVYFQIS